MDGTSVLFHPGAGSTGALGLWDDVLERLAVCLVTIERPGLGRSDADPARTLASWPDDVHALCEARGLDRPRTLAFSQGAPFALACAASGIVRAAAIVSGTDELAHPDLEPRLPAEIRELVRSVATDPSAAEAWFATLTAARLHAMSVEVAPSVDRAIYERPEFAVAYREALAEGFAQGAAGYARDAVLAFGRWPFDPAAISIPVALFYGAGDDSPVHSPDRLASLARRIPHATHRVLEGGGAVLWTQTETILAALLAR